MTVKLDRLIARLGDQTHAVFGPDGTLAFTVGYGTLPRRCPYKLGDRVQMHAYPGDRRSTLGRTTGFRGFVLGGMGGTILRGLTDDGRDWSESYGGLVPDGQPGDNIVACTCCPDPRRVAAATRPADLLDLLAGAR